MQKSKPVFRRPTADEKTVLSAMTVRLLVLKARDEFIGWTEEQRRQRLALVVNNSRSYVLEDCHYHNLVSRFMKLMLGRLSSDWESF